MRSVALESKKFNGVGVKALNGCATLRAVTFVWTEKIIKHCSLFRCVYVLRPVGRGT